MNKIIHCHFTYLIELANGWLITILPSNLLSLKPRSHSVAQTRGELRQLCSCSVEGIRHLDSFSVLTDYNYNVLS